MDRSRLHRTASQPALFIVGAPRCGTTSLAFALAQHSRVAFATPKEPHFFTGLQDPIDPTETRRRYLEQYFGHLSSGHQVLGEGSVSTIYNPAAVSRILQCFPEARFIAMLRNPLDLLPSYHGRMLFLLDEDQRDFRKAWALQTERAAGRKLPRECRDPKLLNYVWIGRIGAALDGLFKAAGRARCHVIVFDDYVDDNRQALMDVLKFVGLEPEGIGPTRPRNVNRAYRYRWLQHLFRRSHEKVSNLADKYNTSESALVPRAIQRVKRWNVVRHRRKPLDPELRLELIDTYWEDIMKLSQLIGRDLTPWLKDRPVSPQATPESARIERAK